MEYLAHHGIKGQRWGVRRYQNEDGSLTEAGRKKYGNHTEKVKGKTLSSYRNKAYNKAYNSDPSKKQGDAYLKKADNLYKTYNFDGDDGGGGITKTDQAAGREYKRLYDKAELAYDKASVNAEKIAKEAVIKEYGTVGYKQLSRRDNAEFALGASIVMSMGAVPLALLVGPDMVRAFKK